MLTVTMLDIFTLRLTFPFSTTTNATLKRLGAEWHKTGKFWTLPIGALDRLIRHCGDDLTAEPEVWLAASPKTPAMVRAENDAWAKRQGAPQASKPQTTTLAPTAFDQLLIDGLPRWAANAEKQQAIQVQRSKQWRRS